MSTSLFQILQKKNLASLIALGGILTAITVALTTLGNVLSLVEILQYLALTPIIIAGMTRGTAFSIQVAVASTLLVGLIWGFFPGALFFFLSIVPLGVTLGYLFRKNRSSSHIIICTVIILSISIASIVWISIKLCGVDWQKDIQSMAATLHLSASFLGEIFPSLLLLTALCYAFYIWIFNAYLLTRIGLMTREKHYFFDIIEFFKLPEYLLGILLLGIILRFIYPGGALYQMAGTNIIFVTSALFFFMGVFLTGIMVRRKLGKTAGLFFYFFAISIGIPIMVFCGIISTIFKRKFGY